MRVIHDLREGVRCSGGVQIVCRDLQSGAETGQVRRELWVLCIGGHLLKPVHELGGTAHVLADMVSEVGALVLHAPASRDVDKLGAHKNASIVAERTVTHLL